MVIISILSAILIPGLVSYTDKAKDEFDKNFNIILSVWVELWTIMKLQAFLKMIKYLLLLKKMVIGIINQNTEELMAMKYVENNKYIIYTYENGWGEVQTKE